MAILAAPILMAMVGQIHQMLFPMISLNGMIQMATDLEMNRMELMETIVLTFQGTQQWDYLAALM